MRAWCGSPGSTCAARPTAVRARIGLAGQFAAVDDHLTGRENIDMIGRLYGLSRREAARPHRASCWTASASATPRPAGQDLLRRHAPPHRPGRLASSAARRCCSSTSPPPASTRPAGATLWDLIRDLVDGGTTVLLTTQYLDEADQLADRIGVINHGRLVSEGTPEQLKNRTGRRRARTVHSRQPAGRGDAALGQIAPRGVRPAPRHARPRPPPTASPPCSMRCGCSTPPASRPTDVGLHRPTLDDVFLALTRTDAPSDRNDAGRQRYDHRDVSQTAPRSGRALAHTGVITRRNLLANVRLPDVLLLSTIQPVIFMLMFLYVFGGAIETALPAAAGASTSTGSSPASWPSPPSSASAPTAYGLTTTAPTASSTGSDPCRWPAPPCSPAARLPT